MTALSQRSGVLVVDKPAGVTSFDVVAQVRRRLGLRRVGHAGTLDPAATGVLPVLLGEATKLMPYLADQDKEYRAVVRFGVRTDTQDLSGRVLDEVAVPALTRQAVATAASRFHGRIRQTPPMYSAVHHEGQRLYELARAGVEVPRMPREVVVHAIDVEEVTGHRATLRVVCGKGTYIRTLVADIGDALGVGGAVDSLRRLRVGPFTLDGAVAWAELEQPATADLRARIAPPDAALAVWPVVRLDAERVEPFRHGQSVAGGAAEHGGSATHRRASGATAPQALSEHGVPPGFVRVHGPDGVFVGVGRVDAGTGRLRPVRILHADRPDARVLPG